MKKSILCGGLGTVYFGGALTYFTNIDYSMWQFYAIIIPVLLAFSLEKNFAKDGE